MHIKKHLSVLAFMAVLANLALSSLVFAQNQSATGTQPVGCDPVVFTFSNNIPNDFSFASRFISNNNDQVTYNNQEAADQVGVLSETPISCAGPLYAISLTIQADSMFYEDMDASNSYTVDDRPLRTSVAQFDSPKTAILSFSHDSATCDASPACTLAGGSLVTATVDGSNNRFTNASGTGETIVSINGVLINSWDLDTNNDGALNAGDLWSAEAGFGLGTITLFQSTAGFDGEVTIDNIVYHIALPANIDNAGIGSKTYITSVTYTL